MNIQVIDESVSNSRSTIIKVVGAGGGGCNAVNRMIECGLSGVDFIAVNTDQQVLNQCRAETKLPIGSKLTQGLGAGGDPLVGEKAALEDRDMIANAVKGAHMVFVTAGMGGGTGTGAAPIIAQVARENGALTVGVVTKPFEIEGDYRMCIAGEGIDKMREAVDSLIVIQNERLFEVMDKKATMKDAFLKADEILHQGVQSISDLILETGLINVDFADVKKTMCGQGDALMGIGVGEGDNGAEEAAIRAVDNPLLDDTTIEGAKRLLVNVSGSEELGMAEFRNAIRIVKEKADPSVQLKPGLVINPLLGKKVMVTVIATGFQPKTIKMEQPGDSSNEVISIGEWKNITNRSAAGKTEFLTLRKNYSEDDLDVPAIMRFSSEQTQPSGSANREVMDL
ncbi:MAG: cell division protein FtsZ [Treponema sp.]|jgi:cell division protein FtsZ|nr:cell division protein FtsZ [Treponema sp.]